MLIHQVSTGVWGTYENLADEKESMDSLMEMLESIYLKHTNIKRKAQVTSQEGSLYEP